MYDRKYDAGDVGVGVGVDVRAMVCSSISKFILLYQIERNLKSQDAASESCEFVLRDILRSILRSILLWFRRDFEISGAISR